MAIERKPWQRLLSEMRDAVVNNGGGGGQVDIGNFVTIFATAGNMNIGEQATFENYALTALYYGSNQLVAMDTLFDSCDIAANLIAEIEIPDATIDGFYVATLDETDKYTSVEEVAIEYDFDAGILTFTVPDLSDDPDNFAYLFIKFATE